MESAFPLSFNRLLLGQIFSVLAANSLFLGKSSSYSFLNFFAQALATIDSYNLFEDF